MEIGIKQSQPELECQFHGVPAVCPHPGASPLWTCSPDCKRGKLGLPGGPVEVAIPQMMLASNARISPPFCTGGTDSLQKPENLPLLPHCPWATRFLQKEAASGSWWPAARARGQLSGLAARTTLIYNIQRPAQSMDQWCPPPLFF